MSGYRHTECFLSVGTFALFLIPFFFSRKFLIFDCCIGFPFSNSHLSAVVRKCTAQHLANLVEKVGALRLLSGVKDLTDRILHAVTKLAQDSSQEARYVDTLFVLGLHVL